MENNTKDIYTELGLTTLNTLASIESTYEFISFGCPIFDQFMK